MIILTNTPQIEGKYQYSSSFVSVYEDAYVMRLHSTNPDEDDIDIIMNENELYEMSTRSHGCQIAYEFASIIRDGKRIYSLELEYRNGEYYTAYVEVWDRFEDYIKWMSSVPNLKNKYSYKVHSYKHAYIRTRPITLPAIPDRWHYSERQEYLMDIFKDELEEIKVEIDSKYDKLEYEGKDFSYECKSKDSREDIK